VESIVINWHLIEKCNYQCKYCYAKYEKTANSNSELHRDKTKSVSMLNSVYSFFKEKYGKPVRLNFAGGEPFLSKNLIFLIKTAKEIGYQVSFISNGSLLSEQVAHDIKAYVDMAGFSIDSSASIIDLLIGRSTNGDKVLDKKKLISSINILRDSGSVIKINTVVNEYNKNDDLNKLMEDLRPDKWKILQELSLSGQALNNDAAFYAFIKRHHKYESIIYAENNEQMTHSYLMIDPYGRFYQNNLSQRGYNYSPSILELGAERAFYAIDFDLSKFEKRYQSRSVSPLL